MPGVALHCQEICPCFPPDCTRKHRVDEAAAETLIGNDSFLNSVSALKNVERLGHLYVSDLKENSCLTSMACHPNSCNLTVYNIWENVRLALNINTK